MFYFLINLLKTFSKFTTMMGLSKLTEEARLSQVVPQVFPKVLFFSLKTCIYAYFKVTNKLFVSLHSLSHLWTRSGLPILSVNWWLDDVVRGYVLEPRQTSKRSCFHWYSKKKEKIKNNSQKLWKEGSNSTRMNQSHYICTIT